MACCGQCSDLRRVGLVAGWFSHTRRRTYQCESVGPRSRLCRALARDPHPVPPPRVGQRRLVQHLHLRLSGPGTSGHLASDPVGPPRPCRAQSLGRHPTGHGQLVVDRATSTSVEEVESAVSRQSEASGRQRSGSGHCEYRRTRGVSADCGGPGLGRSPCRRIKSSPPFPVGSRATGEHQRCRYQKAFRKTGC